MKRVAPLRATVTDRYLVAVKPSARRTNPAVGRAVNRDGTRHEFADRAAAERWATELSSEGPLVWVRAANPADDAVDAYLMGRRRRPAADGTGDTTPAGEQAAVDAFSG